MVNVTDEMIRAARNEMKPFVAPNDDTLRSAITAALTAQGKEEGEVEPVAWTQEDAERENTAFTAWFKERGYPNYPDHYPLITENAMHSAWQEAAKRTAFTAPPSAKRGEVEELETALDTLWKEAESAYCQALGRFSKTECLGWEIKVKTGKFGKAEFDAHKQANELIGRHFGIAHAVKAIRSALHSSSVEKVERVETGGEQDIDPAPSTHLRGDGEAAIIECLSEGKPFVFDPATNFLHANDGTVEGGILYLPEDTAMTVIVKPLEWRHFDSGDASARSVLDAYFAHTDGTWCVRNGERIQAGVTLEDAKSAAQADYSARIFSTLEVCFNG